MRRLLLLAILALATALAVPTVALAADPVQRPFAGRCETAPIIGPSPTPGALFRVTFVGSCRLTHLGRTSQVAVEDVFAGPGGLTLAGTSTYTAADGDSFTTTFAGPVQQTGPTTVSFEGTEIVVGGTGRFVGATGATRFAGSAVTAPPGQPGAGWFTVEGTISY
jgi:hypothetical protein